MVRGAVRVDLLEDRLPEVLVELRAARLERRRQELLLVPVRAVHLRGTHRRDRPRRVGGIKVNRA